MRDANDEMVFMCEHDFRLNADGEVTCIKCFARDDEMELPVVHHCRRSTDESAETKTSEAKASEFWATQVSFEE